MDAMDPKPLDETVPKNFEGFSSSAAISVESRPRRLSRLMRRARARTNSTARTAERVAARPTVAGE